MYTSDAWSSSFGNVFRTSPLLSWRPTPPPPVLPWQLAQVANTVLPSPSGPATVFSLGLRAHA